MKCVGQDMIERRLINRFSYLRYGLVYMKVLFDKKSIVCVKSKRCEVRDKDKDARTCSMILRLEY